MLRIDLNHQDARNGRSSFHAPVHISHWIGQIGELLTLWLRRTRTRHDLSKLDRHLLRDIGMSERDQHRETARPFWR